MIVREDELFAAAGVLLGSVIHFHREYGPDRSRDQHLSERELEVLRYVAEGHSNKEIATALNRSIHTVQYHRSALRRKLRPQDSAMSFQQLAASIIADRRE